MLCNTLEALWHGGACRSEEGVTAQVLKAGADRREWKETSPRPPPPRHRRTRGVRHTCVVVAVSGGCAAPGWWVCGVRVCPWVVRGSVGSAAAPVRW